MARRTTETSPVRLTPRLPTRLSLSVKSMALSLFAIGRWRRGSRTPELTTRCSAGFCPRGLGFPLRLDQARSGDPGGPLAF